MFDSDIKIDDDICEILGQQREKMKGIVTTIRGNKTAPRG